MSLPVPPPTTRRYELDWLRVLAFGLLILYHIGMYYVANWGWHLKSQHQSEGLQWLMLWSNQWRMSLLFTISGAAVAFIMPKMGAAHFIANRHTRLLLPLLFGMTVVVVPQVYIEAQDIGLIDSSFGFLRFWSHYLNQDSELFTDHKTIGDWHITWNHLWYLIYVFTYSLVVLALYSLYKWFGASKAVHAIAGVFPATLVIVLLPIAWLMVNGALFYERFPRTNAFFDDFFNHGRYFFMFCMGFLWVKRPQLWEHIRTLRHLLLAAALVMFACVLYLFEGGSLGTGAVAGVSSNLVWSANSWLWILCICGWAQVFCNRPNKVIRYLNGGVFCYYILHQTLILLLAFWLKGFNLQAALEAPLLIVGTILGCALGYEALRRLPFLRTLFGIFQHTGTRNKHMSTAHTVCGGQPRI